MIRLRRPVTPPHPNSLTNMTTYSHPLNKKDLRDAAFGKCMYCESKIPHISFADVEHIKPKCAGKFPHLEFAWDNLGYSCSICNNNKSDEYDVSIPFIDPYSEDPTDHLYAFGPLLLHKTNRGEVTISIIKLNRPEIFEKRSERTISVKRLIDLYKSSTGLLQASLKSELLQEAASDKEYSLIVKALLLKESII